MTLLKPDPFRDWTGRATHLRARGGGDGAGACLSPDAVEAAYRRSDLFDKRRKLMDAWAAYCAKIEMDAGKVLHSLVGEHRDSIPEGAGGRPAVAYPSTVDVLTPRHLASKGRW